MARLPTAEWAAPGVLVDFYHLPQDEGECRLLTHGFACWPSLPPAIRPLSKQAFDLAEGPEIGREMLSCHDVEDGCA